MVLNIMIKNECLFCKIQEENYSKEIIFQSDYFYVTKDSYPVIKLHTLIISNRHVPTFFELDDVEVLDLSNILKKQKIDIRNLDDTVTAFNIGINDGKDAGQSINHLHVHLIPRRVGDIDNPQGGVRGVIPNKQKYIRRKTS
tara:strand:- start:541 stop:966 length:426 start_codon:yes stop_codon:yes gene_type:complete